MMSHICYITRRTEDLNEQYLNWHWNDEEKEIIWLGT